MSKADELKKEAEEKTRGCLEFCTERIKDILISTYEEGVINNNFWHKVSEEGYPKDERAYLVVIDYGSLGFEYGVMENINHNQGKPEKVVAWQEIPPYRNEEYHIGG